MKLHFFSFVAGIFEPYLTRFQADAPMVPFVFNELSGVFKKLVGLIVKKDAIDNVQSIAGMLNEKCLQDSKNHFLAYLQSSPHSFLHSQCFVECGFSVNKLTIDDNMQEKSVVSQLTFTIA